MTGASPSNPKRRIVRGRAEAVETLSRGRKPLSREQRARVDVIVAGIVEAMAGQRWVAGRSHHELAARHGVSVERVKDWAAEAGRTLRLLCSIDADEIRTENATHLRALAVDAHEAGEFGDAVRAIAEQNKLLGLNAPERHEHAIAVRAQQLDALPPAERLALAERRIAQWTELRAQLLEQHPELQPTIRVEAITAPEGAEGTT
jgi:hypothetical protein